MSPRKVVIALTICFTFLVAIFAVLKNRDRNRVFLERIDPNTYVTSDLPKLLYLNSLTTDKLDLYSYFGKSATNECLNGKDPSKLGPKEQLLEFIKGPCLPVITVPGLLGSRLSVKIDCETFQENNPEIFDACGWSTCTWWKVWQSMPREEYTLWISDFLGPLSILFHDSVKCWGNIIQLNYNASETDIKKRYTSPVGTEVKIYGQHENQDSKCGFGAVNNIIPSSFQTLYSKGYEGVYQSLVKMGYQPGLNLYAAPFDWRKTTLANGITEMLNQTIRQIYELTGKPTVLIAHSLGNFGALHLLNSLSKEDKDKYIANYVSVTNPLAGSPKSLKTFVGGDMEYVYKKFGINFYAQRMLIKASSGAFDLLPKDIFDFYANSEWLKEWESRARLENHNDVRTSEGRAVWEKVVEKGNYTYKWFPHPLLNCSFGFEQRRDECGLYMYNWSAQPVAHVHNKTYTASKKDLRSLFDEYALTTNLSKELFEDANTNNIQFLTNPDVPVTLIYGSHLATDMTYHWDYDPREFSRQDQFSFPNRTFYSQGDQTVPTSSALLPALKWSWEYDNRHKSGLNNSKPVKTVEICSIYNNKEDIYDEKPSDAPYSVSQNEYIGLPCDCFVQNNTHPVLGQSCDHADILNDSKFVKFITQIVNANYKVQDTSSLLVNYLDDESLKLISQNCPSIGSDTAFFDQIKSVRESPTTISV